MSKLLALVGAGLLIAAPAFAIPTLDQFNVVTNSGGTVYFHTSNFMGYVQTVSVGFSGELSDVYIQVNKAVIPFGGINILDTSSGVPNSTILGTGTYVGETAFGFAHFQTTLFVDGGQEIGLQPFTNFPNDLYSDWVYAGDYYSGGALYYGASNRSVDAGFTTYVDPDANPAAVPEPASWAMFIGGFGLIGAGMRRRRASISFA